MMDHFLTKPISQKIIDIIPHFLFSFASIHTQRSYARDLKSFCEFIKTQSKNTEFLSDINDTDIALWKKHLEDNQKLEPSSVRRKINCLSSLFVFAQKRKFIEINPLKWIKKPAQKNISKTNALTQDEMKKIFSNISEKINCLLKDHTNKLHYKRTLQSYELQYTILKILYGTGLRVSEVCQLNLNDFEIQSDSTGKKKFILHIRKAKGGKEHKVYLNENIAEILQNYIEKYRFYAPHTDALFVRTQQNFHRTTVRYLTPKSVHIMLVTNAQEVNITKKISPHSIRAGVATFLHAKGVPLARIQRQLGHSDVSTTSVYIKKSNEREESAALKLDLDTPYKNLSK